MLQLSTVRRMAYTMGLMSFLGLITCNHSPRDNPLDPVLTPAVEILSVTFDPRQGTATLTWSRYTGDQPFRAYQIYRRLSREITTEQRGTISDRAETTFADTGVEADRSYIYTVMVVNAAGLDAESNPKEVFFPLESPLLHVTFDSQTASAFLSWNRAVNGFTRYDIQRQTEEDPRPLIVHSTTNIEDTTFTDRGLDGNTEYRYTLVTRSSIGREVASTPVTGKFHAFLREWPVPLQMTGGLAIDPEDRLYASSTTPNRISQFTRQGELLRQFPIDPADAGRIGLLLAADRHGVYALVFLDSDFSYVQAFDPMGAQRFRWPSTDRSLLLGIAVSPTGELWVAQTIPQTATSTLYRLDVVTGTPVDTLEVAMSVPNGMTIGQQIGVVTIPFGSEVGFGVFDLTTGIVLRQVGGSPGNGKGQFAAPITSVFGPDGRLFVVDGFNNRIQVFREGEYLTTWGQRGSTPGDFLFSGPSPFGMSLTQVLAGIAADTDGIIYVADTFNNRIQVFEP